MNLLYIAARISGDSLLMIKDMGYDPVSLIRDVEDKLREKGMNWSDTSAVMRDAILRAWRKAGLPDVKIPNFVDNSRDALHELEHMILDPSFDLEEGVSKSKSPVDSVMDEALSWGLSGFTSEQEMDNALYSSYKTLFPESERDRTIGDALRDMKSSPVSGKDRSVMMRSVLRNIENMVRNRLDSKISDSLGPDLSMAFDMSPNTSVGFAMTREFMQLVASRYEDRKEILEKERENAWRRFNLNLINEMRKTSRS